MTRYRRRCSRRPGAFSSPARPATSAAGCCGSSRKPGDRCAAWCGDPRRCRDGTAEQTEIVRGDILEPDSLHEALAGVTAAYYLVHSMAASGPFADADRRGAENFAAAARKSGVTRIVYLGGLGPQHDVSTHLESRHEVGRILRESGVPTIEFRASIISVQEASPSRSCARSWTARPSS
jgi:uncharacterized protein YbjT (DUF2867 family)